MYYDILKASKVKAEVFPDYWTQLWGRKLSASMIKTLTGTLPLTFRTSETALRSYTIYGNNYEHTYSATGTLPLTITTHTAGAVNDWAIYGNDKIGKNRMPVTIRNQVLKGLTITVNNGEITIDGTATATINLSIAGTDIGFDANTQYIFSGIDSGSNNSYYMAITLRRKSDNTFVSQKVVTNQPVTLNVEGNEYNWKWARITVENGAVCDNVKFRPMLRLAETSADFEPYQIGVGQFTENGYIVPLSVNGNTVNIPIGNTPLTASDTATKTSTGVDIATADGTNTISTTLYNKPEMSIEGLDYVGVGEPTNDGWQIPLTVSDGTNTTTVNVPIDAPLTESDTATRTSTGVDIPTYVGTNTISTTFENKPEMTITYKE